MFVGAMRRRATRFTLASGGVAFWLAISGSGAWAQDQWTRSRLTTKLGIRYDGLRTGYPDQFQPASVWLPEVRFPGASVLRWHDITPRASVAYYLSGDDGVTVNQQLK